MEKNPDIVAICYCDFGCPESRQEEVVWIKQSSFSAPEDCNFGKSANEIFDHFQKTYGGYQHGSSKPWRFWMEDIDGNILRDTSDGNAENARTMQLRQNKFVEEFYRKAYPTRYSDCLKKGYFDNPFKSVAQSISEGNW